MNGNSVKRIILLAACLAAVVNTVRAADDGNRILRTVRARYQTINTMTTKVTEVMCDAATGTCRRFQGTAEMKRPAKLRLYITKPEKQLVVCDGKKLIMYLEKEKQAYSFDMSQSSQMLTMLNPLDGLLESEVVSATTDGGSHSLKLSAPEYKGHFTEIILTVDAGSLLITGIEATDAAGNSAKYEFSDIKTNAKVKDSRFEFKLPAGVTVMNQQQ